MAEEGLKNLYFESPNAGCELVRYTRFSCLAGMEETLILIGASLSVPLIILPSDLFPPLYRDVYISSSICIKLFII